MAIKSNKFFNLSNELTTQGTLDGHKLSNAERIEAFKKRKDPIKFKEMYINTSTEIMKIALVLYKCFTMS